jgi:hypothetical protein
MLGRVSHDRNDKDAYEDIAQSELTGDRFDRAH